MAPRGDGERHREVENRPWPGEAFVTGSPIRLLLHPGPAEQAELKVMADQAWEVLVREHEHAVAQLSLEVRRLEQLPCVIVIEPSLSAAF